MYYNCHGKFEVGQKIYEIIACNFLIDFITKELFYVKNNTSKYKLKLSVALHVPGMDYGQVTETSGMQCTDYGTEGLNVIRRDCNQSAKKGNL
jgi:hypothetical protein